MTDSDRQPLRPFGVLLNEYRPRVRAALENVAQEVDAPVDDAVDAVLELIAEYGEQMRPAADDPLERARAAFADEADTDVAEASLVSIAEDVRRATRLMESAGHEVALFLRNVGPPLAVGARCLPEVATLLEQLNHPLREVGAVEWDRVLGPVLGRTAAAHARQVLTEAGWQVIDPAGLRLVTRADNDDPPWAAGLVAAVARLNAALTPDEATVNTLPEAALPALGEVQAYLRRLAGRPLPDDPPAPAF